MRPVGTKGAPLGLARRTPIGSPHNGAKVFYQESKLATDTHQRILDTNSWEIKGKYITQHIGTVDGQRDSTLKSLGEATYQCINRHADLLRQNKASAEQLEVSQSIQKNLFEQNQRLRLANKALKAQNNRASNIKKSVQFESNMIPNSPSKKSKVDESNRK